MGRQYQQLEMNERQQLAELKRQECSIRAMARILHRSPGTVSRELRRNAVQGAYWGATAHQQRQTRYRRGPRKLKPDGDLFQTVVTHLRTGWSPQQISGRLLKMFPDEPAMRVAHETIYCAIYAQPAGALRRELIATLRHGRQTRRPRTRGTDRRGCLPAMTSIHQRPTEADSRLVPGHWEGDFLKGAGNRSAIGTLVERTSRYVVLAKMTDCSAQAALRGFSRKFRTVPALIRRSLTYDQGKEMALHQTLAKRLNLAMYFADPHSPWQRPSNENANGLLREYLPKGSNLSTYSQPQLNAIAKRLNDRPRQCLNFCTPAEVFNNLLANLNPGVALQT
jgi:IS30 family transposase